MDMQYSRLPLRMCILFFLLCSRLTQFLGSCVNASHDDETEKDILENRGCFCDKICARFGDCCFDSEYFSIIGQKVAERNFECKQVSSGHGIYVKKKCKLGWDNEEIRYKCEENTDISEDPRVALTTVGESQTTYRNVYCTLCNEERRFYFLNVQMGCRLVSKRENVSREYYKTQVEFNSTRKKETAVHFFNDRLTVSDTYDLTPAIFRTCIPNIVNTCARVWTNDETRKNCSLYTSVVHDGAKYFKNPFCEYCNKEFSQESTLRHKMRKERQLSDAFASRFAGDSPTTNSKEAHPYQEICLVNKIDELLPSDEVEGNNFSTDNSHVTVDWSSSINDSGELRELSNTLECNTGDNCRYSLLYFSESSPEADLSEIRLGILMVNTICLNISIFFLLFHLIVLALSPKSQRPLDKMVTSFCFSLLLGSSFFLIGQILQQQLCLIVSVLTYYSLLVHYSWMLTMSFDVWQKTCVACRKLPGPETIQKDKFLVYSHLNWLLPGVAALLSLLTQLTDVNPRLEPRFGNRSCWFGQKSAMVIYFAAPVGIEMILSTLFLLFATCTFFRFKNRTGSTTKQSMRAILWTYARLILMAKFTWMTGFFSFWLEKYSMWICFMILHALQSLFIFITCTGKENILNVLYRKKGKGAGNRATQTANRDMLRSVSKDTNRSFSSQKSTEIVSV